MQICYSLLTITKLPHVIFFFLRHLGFIVRVILSILSLLVCFHLTLVDPKLLLPRRRLRRRRSCSVSVTSLLGILDGMYVVWIK